MSQESIFPCERIMDKIYLIRGQKVMIDEDLAVVYQMETKRLNEQVKRNQDRFPPCFLFQLNDEAYQNLMSQNATSRWEGEENSPRSMSGNRSDSSKRSQLQDGDFRTDTHTSHVT